MTIIESIILGAVQGLTEFIPVSSSGHLVIAQNWLGLEASHTFEVMINLGTFLALVIYFRKRIWDILVRIFKEHDLRLARNVVISAIPVLALGYFLDDILGQPFFQNPLVVAFMLVAVGIVMIVIDKLPRASDIKKSEDLTPKRAGFIGVAQTLALIPGTSRSGATMIAGRLAGMTFKEAAEYSFLLSIPVMAAVVLKGFISEDGQAFIRDHFAAWAVSNIAALIFGLVAVGFMLRFLGNGNFKVFGWYRIGLAAVVVVSVIFAR
jgi:undecaprenyl-diphosphatase